MKQDSQAIAEVYNQHGAAYHQSRKGTSGRLHNEFIDMPATLSLLAASLKGKKILDAGCGSGIYSTLLAQKGAVVTGVDISSKMIEIAKKELPGKVAVTYLVGDLYDLPVKDQEFDIIVCAYVLENVEKLAPVFAEFNRVLKSKGNCVFSISHPLRANSKKIEKDGKQVWQVEDYFDRSLRHSDFGNGMIVPKYKRTLEDYVTALSGAGFLVKKILEPQPIKAGQKVDPVGYENAMRLPEILTVEIIKGNNS